MPANPTSHPDPSALAEELEALLQRYPRACGVMVDTSAVSAAAGFLRSLASLRQTQAGAELELASANGLLSAIVATIPGAEPVNVLSQLRKLVEACEPFKRAWETERYHRAISLHHWYQLGKALTAQKPSEAYTEHLAAIRARGKAGPEADRALTNNRPRGT